MIMSKEVDLTSKEWCDLIFEGRNKEYGAYVLRRTSESRHTKAVIYTVVGALALFALIWGYATVKHIIDEQALKDQADQEITAMNMSEEKQKEEEPVQQKIEEKQPEPEKPKIESVAMTELKITEDSKVKNEVKPIKEEDDTKMIGQVTQEGEKLDLSSLKKEDFQKQAPKVELPPPPKPKTEKADDDNKVFTAVEQNPKFPGGEAALMRYLSSHLQYPAMAAEQGIEGKVVLQFVVTKNGSVGEVKIARSLSPDCDNEAKRVVKSLPKFTPGRQNGQAVNVWYTLPVTFKLNR